MKMTLNIVPVGQMRARSCVRGKHAATYKAKEQEKREQCLAGLLAMYQPGEPMVGPIRLVIDVYLPIPKSRPKQWKASALAGFIRPTVKPDSDNLAKHLKDVLTQLRFWEDDKQCVELTVRKWYSDRPRWEIEMSELVDRFGAAA